jgi:hypothetical protein
MADIERYTLADAKQPSPSRWANGKMLPTKMLVTNMPTLSQTRKQVFDFDLRLGRSQFMGGCMPPRY